MPPEEKISIKKPDPRATDLWVTHWFGDSHFYPAGSRIAFCGKDWDDQTWEVSMQKPQFVCPLCEARLQAANKAVNEWDKRNAP
jgi:hypothetical protein